MLFKMLERMPELSSSNSKPPDSTWPADRMVGKVILGPTLLQIHATKMKNAPRKVLAPTASPKAYAAKAVPHRGSVEKMTVVSALDSVFIAKFSP